MAYAYRVDGEHRIKLDDFDPGDDAGLNRKEAEEKTQEYISELIELQELLYAVGSQSLLVVLQGRDTSGKDGTIRHVFGPLNSQSCSVSSFKVPTEVELAHDFLWRIHAETPGVGQIKVFNRSHYEDVLVARVRNLVPKQVWGARYEHINAFERLLAESSTTILKFYLHISKEEQEHRLLKREQDPTKAWKLSVEDWKDRENWDKYTAAYEDALNRCSSREAPWFVVSADKKWFRNLAVVEAIRNAMVPFKKGWLETLKAMGHERIKALDEYRRSLRA